MEEGTHLKPINKLAVASFCFGILIPFSILGAFLSLGFIFAFIGFVTGVISLFQIFKNGSRGKGWAITGIVLSVVIPLIFTLSMVIVNFIVIDQINLIFPFS